jgi:dihydrolipoamide dehydrogenase
MATRHVVVIGAGGAGMSAAQAAASAGARVTVVANEPPGGRTIWHSLLPSKVLLTLADSLGQAERAARLGLSAVGGSPDVAVMTQRIRDLSQSWSDVLLTQLRRLGVQLLQGTATFAGVRQLQVRPSAGAPTTLDADAVVVATGSVPIFPPDLKPDGASIIGPRFIGKLERLPSTLTVVGGGVTGTEFVYGFNRLGVSVTWVVDEFGVLPTFDRETAGFLTKVLRSRGVVLHEGVAARSVSAGDEGVRVTLGDGRSFSTGMALIAIGRRPDVATLGLENAGLSVDPRRGIQVDEFCRSAVPHIYAAGDATGTPLIANKAMAQGWIAGQHAAGTTPAPYAPAAIVEAVYTDPQIAQVGLMEGPAKEMGHAVRVLDLDYEMNLKAALWNESEGFVRLVTESASGVVLGARAVGASAADVLAPVALAVRLKTPVGDVASVFAAHPGLGELAFAAARATAPHEDR